MFASHRISFLFYRMHLHLWEYCIVVQYYCMRLWLIDVDDEEGMTECFFRHTLGDVRGPVQLLLD